MSNKFLAHTGALCLFALLATSTAHALPEKDTGNLGEIRHSLLSVTDFQKIYGDQWELMAGQNIEGSDLFKEKLWMDAHLPDSRGQFLRCSNAGRGADSGNPDGDLAVGSQQMDEFKEHTHQGKTHSGDPKFYRTVHQQGGESAGNHQLGSLAGGGFSDRHDDEWSNSNHTHKLDIVASGGSETRPRCTTVNAFIKINRTPESKQTDFIVNALRGIPKQITENEALIKTIRALVQAEVQKSMNSKSATP